MFKLFERAVEAIFWLRFWVSPALAGALLGGVGFLAVGEGTLGYVVWGALFLVGAVGGVALAEHMRRSAGASASMARLIGTPELDALDKR